MALFKKLAYGASAAALVALAAPVAAYAQQTDATLRGTITDDSGAPVSGASITIIDTRTNRVQTATTSADGTFFRTNLAVGGPYLITVSAEGFEGERVEIGSLSIGSNAPIELSLNTEGREVIVVTGTRTVPVDISNGVGTVYTQDDLQSIPILNRDLTDIAELDPLASVQSGEGELGTISFGGIEPRLNGFTIDGALIADRFKLEEAFYPSLRQPISFDVIEAAAVTFSEYSVLTSGATGGLVNVVTRSGTNEFDGNLFYRYGDDSLVGDESDGTPVSLGAFEEKDYGFTLAGPIIQDKLFFVVNYEEFEATTPIPFGFSQTELDAFAAVRDVFLTATDGSGGLRYDGFDPQIKEDSALDAETSERLFMKFDYQINDAHRASFWYMGVEDARLQNTSGLDFLFPTAYYDKTTEIDLYHVQLTSDWTERLSTTFRIVAKEQITGQNARFDTSATGTEWPTFIIEDVPGLDDAVEAGPDPFRHANGFNDEQLQIFGAADYIWNNHLFTFGFEYLDYELDNIFGQYCRGEYVFADLAALAAGDADVEYQNLPGNSCADRTAAWGYTKWDVFAQDSWQVTPDLSVNFGFRYERFSSDDDPSPAGNFATEYGADSAGDLDGLDIFQPRFGFDWSAPMDTRVQGGFGLFSGGDPVVWFSNAYSPLATLAFGDVTDYADFRSVPSDLQTQVDADTGPFNYDHIDPNFNIPSLWKASIKAEREFDFGPLGDGYLIGVQLAYSQVEDGAAFRNRAQLASEIIDPTLAATVAGNTGVAPDGRPIYSDARSTGDAIQLINTDEGESFAATIAVEKSFDFGLTLYGSYAYTDSDRLIPGSSSRHISNYRSLVTTDRNSAGPAGTSVFEVQDRFVFQARYADELFAPNLTTRISLKGIIESGPVSNAGYVHFLSSGTSRIFGRAAGGSPFSGVDQLYIPTLNSAGDGFNDPLVVFASASDEQRFLQEITDLGLLGQAGGIAEKNGLRGPWNQRWDFGFRQELPGIPGADRWVGDNNFEFTLDIFNVLNFLNSDWGQQIQDPRFDTISVVTPALITAADAAAFRAGTLGMDIEDAYISSSSTGATCQAAADCVYVYDTVIGGDRFDTNFERSVWQLRVGLRYEF